MAEPHDPLETPRRPTKEYEDNHFHDEDEVAPPPLDEEVPLTGVHFPPARPPRKLPPRPRRFDED